MKYKYNLLWDLDDANNERSLFAGEPRYDFKCNKCLTFITNQSAPEKIKPNYCSHCGKKLKVPDNWGCWNCEYIGKCTGKKDEEECTSWKNG